MKLDSKTDLKHLMVDGGMTNGDKVMKVLADIGGFTVIRPEMRECVPPCFFPSPCGSLLCHDVLTQSRAYAGRPHLARRSSRALRSACTVGTSASPRRSPRSTPPAPSTSRPRCPRPSARSVGRGGSAPSSVPSAGRRAWTSRWTSICCGLAASARFEEAREGTKNLAEHLYILYT